MSGSGGVMPYPRGAFFILAGYLLERFVYYGLFGGAVFYMQRMLGFTSSSASTVKAVMEGLIYLAPIAGAILADTYLGKSRTVFIMCCIYTVGAGIFTLSSITPMMGGTGPAKATGIMGLLVMGLSAGLMKAVYSALGADQFVVPEQREQQKRYFYAFYWMINAGAFMGMFMTAQLRDTFQCFGDDCYFLPYVILVVLMVVSTAIFAAGRSRYTEAPPDTTLIRAVRCIGYALRKICDSNRKPVQHWLDRAQDKFDAELILDVKNTLRLLVLFCTYPLFWALFYQTSTGMVFQAKRLDGQVGSYRIPPEMSSTINPLLILTLIPLFDLVIYPLLNKLGYLQVTTSRMIVGMCFAVSSFIAYAIVNTSVEQTLIPATHARLHAYNTLPCQATVIIPDFNEKATIEVGGQIAMPNIDIENIKEVKVNVTSSCSGSDMTLINVVMLGGHETGLVLSPARPRPLPPSLEYIKDEDAEAKVRIIDLTGELKKVTLQYETQKEEFQLNDNGESVYQRLSPQEYVVMVGDINLGEAPVYQDGVYDVIITDSALLSFPVTAPSSVHMFWLFPQYLLLTIGEVLFSVSATDFAYSEAPMAMKSTLQAAKLFAITVGLWIFAILTSLSAATGAFQHRASHEAIFYAALMAANTIIFALLSKWYYKVPKDITTKNTEKDEEKEDFDNRSDWRKCDNPAFIDDQSV